MCKLRSCIWHVKFGGICHTRLQSYFVHQVNVPSVPVGGGRDDSVECEVVGSVEQIDRAVGLIRESIQQSELARRRDALHRRQRTRKPAVRGREGEGEGEGVCCATVLISIVCQSSMWPACGSCLRALWVLYIFLAHGG